MLERRLRMAGRDEEIFKNICEFMLDSGGQAPFVEDLVEVYNLNHGLPNGVQASVSKGTINRSIFRLEEMGLLLIRRSRKSNIRSSGAIRVKGSRFYIDIGPAVAEEIIRGFHEELNRTRNTSK